VTRLGLGLGLGPMVVGHVDEVRAQSRAIIAAKLVVQLGGGEEVVGGVAYEKAVVVEKKAMNGFFEGHDEKVGLGNS